MLRLALVFFLVALIAGTLGFGGIATVSADIAQVLFAIFVVLFLVTLVVGLARRHRKGAFEASRRGDQP